LRLITQRQQHQQQQQQQQTPEVRCYAETHGLHRLEYALPVRFSSDQPKM